jgi:4-hydroxy-tetrahydrodipicolinate synthase
MVLSGVFPASVTPFDDKGQIDYASLARLLAWFTQSGCAGVVVGGSNGEGPLLSAVEKRDLARQAVQLADGLQVIAGLATSSLEEAVWLGEQAAKAGCVAGLVMPPTFGSQNLEGVALWFEALADRTKLPVIVYHHPVMTRVELTLPILQRLLSHPNIGGIKTSSGRREEIAWRSALPDGKSYFVGDESLLFEARKNGWTGTISGAANVLAPWLVRLCSNLEPGVDDMLQPLIRAVRAAPQPATHKAVLHRESVLKTPTPRLPLLPAEGEEIWSLIKRTLG